MPSSNNCPTASHSPELTTGLRLPLRQHCPVPLGQSRAPTGALMPQCYRTGSVTVLPQWSHKSICSWLIFRWYGLEMTRTPTQNSYKALISKEGAINTRAGQPEEIQRPPGSEDQYQRPAPSRADSQQQAQATVKECWLAVAKTSSWLCQSRASSIICCPLVASMLLAEMYIANSKLLAKPSKRTPDLFFVLRIALLYDVFCDFKLISWLCLLLYEECHSYFHRNCPGSVH